jgi:putative DNA primase/helicase
VPRGIGDNWRSVPEPISEDVVAVEFVERYGQDVRYDHTAKSWLVFDGVCWKQDQTGAVFDLIRGLTRDLVRDKERGTQKAAGKAAFLRGVEEHTRHDRRIAVTSDCWDRNPFLLGTPAGVIDLQEGIKRQARRQDCITKQVAVAPSDTLECQRWLQFLDEVTGGDPDVKRFLQQWAGYLLTGDTREHALVYIHGPGGNGKSVFVNTLASLLRDYARAAGMETFTSSPFDRHPEELARLEGARMVYASETEANRRWAENRIKQVTGGDKITARNMRQNSFEYRPQFKLTLMGNHAPAISNLDDAIRRRFLIVPFTRKPDQPDVELDEKLKAEWPGILRWAIEGAKDWLANGLIRPEAINQATAQYFEDQDLLGEWLDECCEVKRDSSAFAEKSRALFGSYEVFAEQRGEDGGTQRTFNDSLRQRGFEGPIKIRFSDANTKGFRGIKLKRASCFNELAGDRA